MEGPLCPDGTRLIETLKWNGGQLVRAARHLARLRASASALGFAIDAPALRMALAGIDGADPQRVRLTLGKTGDIEISATPLAPSAAAWRLTLAGDRLSSDDPLLRHKTTHRPLYDRARATLPEGIDEMIFANEHGEICEGTITSVFFDLGRGLATPPLRCGCLPGILRAEMLDRGICHEAVLNIRELPGARLWVGNSLRGLIPSHLAP